MSKFTFPLIVFFAFVFVCSETVSGQCACAKRNITALEEYKDATVVFTGEILEIERSEPENNDRSYETVKVSVDRVWKKNVDQIVTIKNYIHGCVQGWKKGDKYLVYAYLNDDKATYSTRCCCSRTAQFEKAEADVAAFFNAGFGLSHVNAPSKEKIISAGWMNSRAVNFRQPQFPPGIKEPRPSVRVDVRIITDIDGNVISAEVIRGPVDFHRAALDAARELKFPRTSLSGVPTKVVGWVSFDLKP